MFERNWMEQLSGENFIINDLLLEYSRNPFIYHLSTFLATAGTNLTLSLPSQLNSLTYGNKSRSFFTVMAKQP